MSWFEGLLVVTTLLCSLVAGFVFAFAVVVMPGIRSLSDRDFLRAFQVMDRVIQKNHPAFMLVWVGSIVSLIASATFSFGQLSGSRLVVMLAATGLYLLTVQLPTFAINIPLNNGLQALDVDELDPTQLDEARSAFESRWNRWNNIRTVSACLTSCLLMALLLWH